MAVTFYIQGGYLEMPKSLFVKEVLNASSVLKRLLNYEIEDHDKKRVIEIDKEKNTDKVRINFTDGSNVSVGEDYKNLLREMKQRYREQVRGEITLRGEYFVTFYLQLDLNSEDDSIREVF
jgi:hypothetical protein